MSPFTQLRWTPARGDPSERFTLIDRYLGTSDGGGRVAYEGIPRASELAGLGIELIDTGRRGDMSTGASARLWHLLWTRDEARSSVGVSSPEGDPSWPITPGDTLPVPVGMTLRATGGQLAIAVSLPDGEIAAAAPSHGTDRLFGFNRRTVSFQAAGIRLCRWKITRPLALADHHRAPMIVMALARTVVIHAAGSIDRLAQGEAALIDPAATPVLLPDGLAYLLTIDRLPG